MRHPGETTAPVANRCLPHRPAQQHGLLYMYMLTETLATFPIDVSDPGLVALPLVVGNAKVKDDEGIFNERSFPLAQGDVEPTSALVPEGMTPDSSDAVDWGRSPSDPAEFPRTDDRGSW